jgi:2-polyprenyl-6-methoxyphenol hydroxylase-like FAD-dependent oxidoreductase
LAFFASKAVSEVWSKLLPHIKSAGNVMTEKSQVPVLICGGGPVGLALAIELGLRGVECMLVEQGDGSVPVPKMSQLSTRTTEFCRRWGVMDQVKKVAWPETHPGDFVYITSMIGYELFRRKYPSYAERGELGYTPEGARQCPQIFFDPILLEHARSLPQITLRHRTRLDSPAEAGDRISARVIDLVSGQSETISASYLVGCDGFEGHVRRALEIGITGSGVLSFSISIFFRSRELASLHDKGWAKFYRMVDEGGHWSDLVAIDGHELWRLTLLDLDPNTEMDSFDSLRRAAGTSFSYELISVLPWRRRESIADHYRNGRVFIAGDAAHQCSPTGGLGMNTGLADAVDIGWKLAAVLDGWGGELLLDSYEAERRPVALSHVTSSTRMYQQTVALPGGSAINEKSLEGERVRRQFVEIYRAQHRAGMNVISENVKLGYCYENSPIIWPDETTPPEDAGEYTPTARPGTRAPHAWIGEGCSTLDLFGDGFVLLKFDRNSDPSSLVVAAAARRVPLKIVDINNRDIAALYERKLVLVRPDGHVAWRADTSPADAFALIDRVRGAGSA